MAHGYLEGYSTTHAISEYISTVYFEVFEQTGYIVGHTFVTQFPGDIPCAAMALHFGYYYFPVICQEGYDVRPIHGYSHVRAMDQYDGFTIAVYLIVHF